MGVFFVMVDRVSILFNFFVTNEENLQQFNRCGHMKSMKKHT